MLSMLNIEGKWSQCRISELGLGGKNNGQVLDDRCFYLSHRFTLSCCGKKGKVPRLEGASNMRLPRGL
jgi:hypothetical protein